MKGEIIMNLVKTLKNAYYGSDGKLVSQIKSCLTQTEEAKTISPEDTNGFPSAAIMPKIDTILKKRKEYKSIKASNDKDKQLPILDREVKNACSESSGLLNTDVSKLNDRESALSNELKNKLEQAKNNYNKRIKQIKSEYSPRLKAVRDLSITLKKLSDILAAKASKIKN